MVELSREYAGVVEAQNRVEKSTTGIINVLFISSLVLYRGRQFFCVSVSVSISPLIVSPRHYEGTLPGGNTNILFCRPPVPD